MYLGYNEKQSVKTEEAVKNEFNYGREFVQKLYR